MLVGNKIDKVSSKIQHLGFLYFCCGELDAKDVSSLIPCLIWNNFHVDNFSVQNKIYVRKEKEGSCLSDRKGRPEKMVEDVSFIHHLREGEKD